MPLFNLRKKMSNPFIRNFDELIINLKNDFESKESSLYIAKDDENSMIKELLVQNLEREINGKKVSFIAIRNIVLKEEFKGKGYFSNFLIELENLRKNIMFHDVINNRLMIYLKSKNYHEYKEKKYEEEVISLYKVF